MQLHIDSGICKWSSTFNIIINTHLLVLVFLYEGGDQDGLVSHVSRLLCGTPVLVPAILPLQTLQHH